MLSDFGYIDWQDASYAPARQWSGRFPDKLEAVLDGLMHSLSTERSNPSHYHHLFVDKDQSTDGM